jgi:hypothetical protein
MVLLGFSWEMKYIHLLSCHLKVKTATNEIQQSHLAEKQIFRLTHNPILLNIEINSFFSIIFIVLLKLWQTYQTLLHI